MRARRHIETTAGIFVIAINMAAVNAKADEFAFSSYGLGGAAFGAGATPPPGTYVSFVTGYYQGEIKGPVTIGNALLDVGLKIEFFQAAVNGLYVAERKVLDGHFGLSATVPVGHIDLEAGVTGPLNNTFTRETAGWGLGDITVKAQLGWQQGTFAHTAYVQAVAPSGRYSPTFAPNIGLNRPGIDTGWAFTWLEAKTQLQFNGALGVTFNFENDETDYDSGTDFHFEWAVGREICKGLTIGVVGYDYRQLTGDSGDGAILGPFEGSVDAIGGGVTYTTVVGKTPLILNARHYQEYNADRRMDGSMTILSGTVRY